MPEWNFCTWEWARSDTKHGESMDRVFFSVEVRHSCVYTRRTHKERAAYKTVTRLDSHVCRPRERQSLSYRLQAMTSFDWEVIELEYLKGMVLVPSEVLACRIDRQESHFPRLSRSSLDSRRLDCGSVDGSFLCEVRVT